MKVGVLPCGDLISSLIPALGGGTRHEGTAGARYGKSDWEAGRGNRKASERLEANDIAR